MSVTPPVNYAQCFHRWRRLPLQAYWSEHRHFKWSIAVSARCAGWGANFPMVDDAD